MSHFTALVITDNGTEAEIERALQPYHEFECTGLVDDYVQSIDVTEDARLDWQKEQKQRPELSFLEFIQEEYAADLILRPGEAPDLLDRCKWGWVQLDTNSEVAAVIKRTNPNKKWDYWEIGGRWKDRLVTRAGTKVSSCQAADLDLAALALGFAVIKDSHWYSLGDMGWFGISRDDKDDWPEERTKLLSSAGATQWATIVDCHI